MNVHYYIGFTTTVGEYTRKKILRGCIKMYNNQLTEEKAKKKKKKRIFRNGISIREISRERIL